MAYKEQLSSISMTASAALASLGSDVTQFTAVIPNGNGDAVHPAGIALSGVKGAGQTIDVVIGGKAKIRLAAGLTANTRVTVNSAGLGITAGPTDHGIGVAMQAGLAGDVVEIVLVSQTVLPP